MANFTKKELQELAGLSKGAFFMHWPKAEELGLVKVTKTVGLAKLYTLNTASTLIKDILRFEMHMIEETAPKKAMAVAQYSFPRKRLSHENREN